MLVLLLSKKEDNSAFIGIGTNLGDRKENVKNALAEIKKIAEIVALSPIYETEPFGVLQQPLFYNLVIEIKTSFPPHQLLRSLQDIERNMGRVRTMRYGPRIIDLDILYYDNIIITSENLVIPHPRASVRPTVLVPLCTIAPHFIDPVLQKSIEALTLLVEPDEKKKIICVYVF
jgi:2-amino-4-hydroxy-6-hydroxymethyldihydropteridine diphosphokinase